MPEQENTLNVLVSEDDPDEQYLLKSALIDAGPGTRVDFVLTGDQLIQHLLRNVLSRTDQLVVLPDLIIAELRKPFFWFDALRELRIYSQFRHIPVILFSMRSNEELRQAAILNGASALYDKPHTYHELRRIIREISKSLRRGN